jgi:broad specificity phosphatase PhoE
VIETTIDFIRHGEPVGGRRYRGHAIDDPLSEKGWAQMWSAVEGGQWQQVLTSPLLRCQEFAQALATRQAIPVALEQRLQEVGFGSWEGQRPEEIEQQKPQEYTAFYADPINQRPAGAEPWEAFSQRVVAAFEDLQQRYAGQRLLVVTHAGVIRAVLAHVLQASARAAYGIKVANAGLTRFQCQGSLCSLQFHNRRRVS